MKEKDQKNMSEIAYNIFITFFKESCVKINDEQAKIHPSLEHPEITLGNMGMLEKYSEIKGYTSEIKVFGMSIIPAYVHRKESSITFDDAQIGYSIKIDIMNSLPMYLNNDNLAKDPIAEVERAGELILKDGPLKFAKNYENTVGSLNKVKEVYISGSLLRTLESGKKLEEVLR